MPLWGKEDKKSDAPKFIVKAETGESGKEVYGNTTVQGVFGVDDAETTVADGVTHSGWVKRTVNTGGRNNGTGKPRIQEETLVAGGITGDATSFADDGVANSSGAADDTQYPDTE